MDKHHKIIKDVNEYYSNKVDEFGATPMGVDWNSEESHQLRFEQLTKLFNVKHSFSILDYGCGYGALYKYLKGKFPYFNYTGFDNSQSMIETAKKLYPEKKVKWITKINSEHKFDYIIACGIFNVKLKHSNREWLSYVIDTLNLLNKISTKGFSFNILTKYSDRDYMKNYLYYAEPEKIFGYCKKNFSKKISLLHDYPLYEFSIIVRKD